MQPAAGRRELFGVDRLDALLLACAASAAAGECIDRVRAEVNTFSENAPPSDDQTLIAIRCR
jgi:serine phosphatase RsbU (regulator of sigma subunit)